MLVHRLSVGSAIEAAWVFRFREDAPAAIMWNAVSFRMGTGRLVTRYDADAQETYRIQTIENNAMLTLTLGGSQMVSLRP
jgi:hypothetical protein